VDSFRCPIRPVCFDTSSTLPFFRALDSFDSAADNQRADAPPVCVLSVFCLCFFSAFALILSRLFLGFRVRNVKFC
jgi:hypothetical protein